jgi:hypothetical protein
MVANARRSRDEQLGHGIPIRRMDIVGDLAIVDDQNPVGDFDGPRIVGREEDGLSEAVAR